MKLILVLVLAVAAVSRASARLGDTEDRAIERYGIPSPVNVTGTPLIQGARQLTFEYHGWRIRCALLLASNGKEYVVREDYAKIWNSEVMKAGGSPSIKDFECAAILEGELKEGMKWSRKLIGDLSVNPIKAYQNQFVNAFQGTTWIRQDGAIAVLQIGRSSLRLELPQAARYEAQLKAIKERKAREAVPKF